MPAETMEVACPVAPADDWVARTAEQVRAEGERRHPGEAPTCASGISPSGPVHLGNLRELMVPHLIADEVRRSGAPCRHILSWDDYDRFRRVPAGFPESFAEHIGRPLTAVPDPCDRHQSWAEHFKEPLRDSLARLGVRVTEISQTQMYTSGAYTPQIVTAMRRRAEIGAVLAKYRTRRAADPDDDDPRGAAAYYPFRPYCAACGRDDTTVTGFDDESTEITYVCACGAQHGPIPIAQVAGKLAWKVDWPMRWAYERVTFEPAGVDHSSPGSSFTVGGELVSEIFGGEMPLHFGYSFVGTSGSAGSAKMSSSAGGAPTPADALEIFEPPLIRWLYARRRPEQAITLAFDQEVGRVYDEWDALSRRVAGGEADTVLAAVYARAAGTSQGLLPTTPRPMKFATLASVADITAGDEVQILRILRDLTVEDPVATLDEVRPRLDCAQAWVAGYVGPEDRTQVRPEPDSAQLAALSDADRDALKLLTEGMADYWSLDGMTVLLYGIPRLQLGLPISAPPTPEVKVLQKAWFRLLYQLLIGKDKGPRLPTLALALGQDQIRYLLTPAA